MSSRTSFLVGLSLASAATLALAGCSATASDSSDAAGSSDTVAIVASTNVYGDLAAQVGGDLVSVTSIIDSPDKDPHEYEADARTQLALSKAQIVIENGGGYDDFVDTMLSASDNSDATVLNAVDISGYDTEPAEGEFNEHVWYDFPTVEKVVDEIAAELGSIDSANADTYTANAATLKTSIDALEAKEAELKTSYAGAGVAITEPVPLYVLDAIGLVNETPDEFSEAIEEDTDVAPTVLEETLALFSDKKVSLLAYNEQTTGAQTEAVLDAAKSASIAVVPVTETLPDGSDYITWMTANLDAIGEALASVDATAAPATK